MEFPAPVHDRRMVRIGDCAERGAHAPRLVSLRTGDSGICADLLRRPRSAPPKPQCGQGQPHRASDETDFGKRSRQVRPIAYRARSSVSLAIWAARRKMDRIRFTEWPSIVERETTMPTTTATRHR